MIKLVDYTDGVELTLKDTQTKATADSVYLNHNVRHQITETGSARWRDISVNTESLTYYGKPSFVLRISTKNFKWVLILSIEDADKFIHYLKGEQDEIS